MCCAERRSSRRRVVLSRDFVSGLHEAVQRRVVSPAEGRCRQASRNKQQLRVRVQRHAGRRHCFLQRQRSQRRRSRLHAGASQLSAGSCQRRTRWKYRCNALLQGLGAAMLSMQEGAHWDVVVPPQLAYQGTKHGAIARAAAVLCAARLCLCIVTCVPSVLRQVLQPATTALLFLRGACSSSILNWYK